MKKLRPKRRWPALHNQPQEQRTGTWILCSLGPMNINSSDIHHTRGSGIWPPPTFQCQSLTMIPYSSLGSLTEWQFSFLSTFAQMFLVLPKVDLFSSFKSEPLPLIPQRPNLSWVPSSVFPWHPLPLLVTALSICCVASPPDCDHLRKKENTLCTPVKFRGLLPRSLCIDSSDLPGVREWKKCNCSEEHGQYRSNILWLWTPPSFLALMKKVPLPFWSLFLINSVCNTWLETKHPNKMAVTSFSHGCLFN